MSFTLRPRFLPDRDALVEWGDKGAGVVRMIRKGFRVPPSAAFGISEIHAWRTMPAHERAVMPEHWPQSAETLARLLTGGESWPLLLRLSPKLPGAARGHREIERADPELLWRAFTELSESVPAHVPFAILIQPKLVSEERGTYPESALPQGETELLTRSAVARTLLGIEAELDWQWDGEELWFTAIRPSRKIFRNVRQLLVDLDGTLLLARELPLRLSFIRSTLRGFRRHGSLLQGLRGLRAMTRESENASGTDVNRLRTTDVFAKAFGVNFALAETILEEAVIRPFPTLQRHFYGAPGAVDFLDWAKERFPMVLATNPVWPQSIVELRVNWAGIAPGTFRSITHSDRMHASKPHPAYYEELLAQEGFEAPQSLLIGDHMKMDLPAARVGVPVFILRNGTSSPLKPLVLIGGKAPAWQGSFLQLQALLFSAQRSL